MVPLPTVLPESSQEPGCGSSSFDLSFQLHPAAGEIIILDVDKEEGCFHGFSVVLLNGCFFIVTGLGSFAPGALRFIAALQFALAGGTGVQPLRMAGIDGAFSCFDPPHLGFHLVIILGFKHGRSP
jgi:hypothetical protein